MTRTRKFDNLGPGSLESITLSIWRNLNGAKKESVWTDYFVKVVGTYTVYCGQGNSHVVTIVETRNSRDLHQGKNLARAAYHDWDLDSAFDLAGMVVSDYLGDTWSDPCDQCDR